MKKFKISYRPEIDGLRAIAIISIILYHSKIVLNNTDWFEGGFVGVDIFFVISGYLITRIILNEIMINGSFNFLNFYERRIRRILPMLFFVIFFSMPFAWYKLFPADFVNYSDSIIASIFFVSNFFFYFNGMEYGATNSLLLPLLHTWSLSIEEQFYLIAPITLLIIYKFFRSHILILLIVFSLLSFLSAILMQEINPKLNFYFSLSRFWELLLGSLIVYIELNYKIPSNKIIGYIFPLLGLSLILYSIFFFNAQTAHPSFNTLIPVLGTVIIIIFCSDKSGIISKVLGSKPFVSIGLVSYSAYLWHFPVLAFSRINSIEPNNLYKVWLLLFVLLISTLSYHFIEKPFRNKNFIKLRQLMLILIVSILITVFIFTLSKYKNGFPDRFPKEGWINFEINTTNLKKDFWKKFDENKMSLSKPHQKKINVYIFGNSHSGDTLDAFLHAKDYYNEFHFLKISKNEEISCFDERDPRFSGKRNALYESEAYKKTDIFIIASRFSDIKCNKKLNHSPTDIDGLNYLIPKLKRDGKKIIILGNTLVLDQIEGKWLAEYIYLKAINEKTDSFLTFENFNYYKNIAEKKAYELQNDLNIKINNKLQNFSLKNDIGYFERRKIFCDENIKRCDVFSKDGNRLRYDYGHLTTEGKEKFSELLRKSNFKSILLDTWRNQNSSN